MVILRSSPERRQEISLAGWSQTSIPEGFRVGYDEEKDPAHGFAVSLVVIAKAESIEPIFAESI